MKKFDNFISHLEVLKKAPGENLENEFIISGIIDKFCIQFELSWKVLKELLLYQGIEAGKTGSPREIIKAAYRCFEFIEQDIWLSMLKDRNDTSHIYNKMLAQKLVTRILDAYIPAFISMADSIHASYEDVLKELK